jgi:hypothetical protein
MKPIAITVSRWPLLMLKPVAIQGTIGLVLPPQRGSMNKNLYCMISDLS